MILLELTEREFESIRFTMDQQLATSELLCKVEGGENNRKNLDTHNSILSKLKLASEPKQDALITSKDFSDIKDLTNREYQFLLPDTHISNKRVEERDLVHISLANAVIMWLNGRNLLKKLVKFDFTDSSYQYEES
jgi:hypothetical protein